MRKAALLPFLFVALSATVAGASDSLLGAWKEVYSSTGQLMFPRLEIRRDSGEYQLVVNGKPLNNRYHGTDVQIARQWTLNKNELMDLYPGVPEPVRRAVEGRAWKRVTLTIQPGGSSLLVETTNGQIMFTGNRFDDYNPVDSIDRQTFERIGEPPLPAGIRLTESGSGVFTCYIADGQRSGCLDVRNNATRRVRVYLEGAPGVLCTVDPGVYCSVPIPFGEHGVRVEPDDERGIGPPMRSQITMGASGIRLAVEGSTD